MNVDWLVTLGFLDLYQKRILILEWYGFFAGCPSCPTTSGVEKAGDKSPIGFILS